MNRRIGFQFNNSYLSLPNCFYTKLKPEPVSSPEITIFNDELSSSLGLNFSDLTPKEKAEIFSGNNLLDDGGYFAQAYAGHQFGHFTMLGDGRALILGEHITPNNERFDIQLKGSGQTPYSRRGDGRAALGPMLREFIISEAMHHLGIPTTRSLAVVKTGEPVFRETPLPGAILTRVASSHIRVGTLEFAAAQDNISHTKALLDYTIARHYPELSNTENKAAALLKAVVKRQVNLITEWMRVGFIHGVMNTDNMLLSGETIDYGPCAFMDNYDPDTVFSSIDHQGRYAYRNQPLLAQWNLARLAESLLPLIDDNPNQAIEIAEEIIHLFSTLYQEKWLSMMRMKLGLFNEDKKDKELIETLLKWMQKNNVDFTNTFRELSQEKKPKSTLYQSKNFDDWHTSWQARLEQNPEPEQNSINLMQQNNPAIIPRNHKVEQALQAAESDNLNPLNELVDALKEPYSDNPKLKDYQLPPQPSERIYQTFCGT